MLQNFVFVLLFKSLTIDSTVHVFDPKKIQYCTMKCWNNVPSSGCECQKKERREELPVTLAFRKKMLKLHNDYRNKVARGELIDENFPKSSRMMALSYDVELEYLARCYGLTWFIKSLDSCKLPSFCRRRLGASQNIYGRSDKVTDLNFMDTVVKVWFNKYTLIPQDERLDVIKRYQPQGEGNSFTQVVWGLHTRVGCARIWNPGNPQVNWKFAVICNYAGSDDSCPGNIKMEEVYEIGEPCSECRSLRCNNQTTGGKYDALCGPINAIPLEIPTIAKQKRLKRSGGGGKIRGASSAEGRPQFDKFLLAVTVCTVIQSKIVGLY